MGRIYKAFDLINDGKTINVVALVDTGSDRTLVSASVAESLGITGKIGDHIQIANGDIIEAILGKVRIVSHRDDIDFEMDVDITEVPFEIDHEAGIDMIVGVDFLQEHNVKLSFGKG